MSSTNHSERPDSWTSTRLENVVERTRGRKDPQDYPDLPYLGLKHIEEETMGLLGKSRSEEYQSTSVHFLPGDILYGRLRPYLNKVHLTDFEGLGSGEIIVLTPTDDIYSRYLMYLLNSQEFVRYSDHRSTGDRPRVNYDKIKEFELPLPPLAEQKRIVAKIEELFSKLDSGISELEETEQRLGMYRQALLHKATTGELTTAWRNDEAESTSTLDAIQDLRKQLIEKKGTSKLKDPNKADGSDNLPSNWEHATIKQISYSTRYGTSEKCDYDFNGPPVLRIPNIQNGAIDLDDLKFARSGADLSNIDPLEPGDFLMVRTNGSSDLIGRAAVVRDEFDEPTYFASYLIRFRITPVDPLPRWVNFVWNSWPIREKILEESATSAGQYNLSQSKVLQFVLPLPPLEEQKQILEQVGQKMSVIDQLEQDLETELTRSKRLRQAILKHAFKGNLVPQDPAEEPCTPDGGDTNLEPREQTTLSEVTSDVE